MFESSDPDKEIEDIKHVSWPMNVYLADYTVEDKLNQSNTDAQTFVNIQFNVVLTQMENRQFRTINEQTVEVPDTSGRLEYLSRIKQVRVPKPHQPRFVT